jgi:hypothetical protein
MPPELYSIDFILLIIVEESTTLMLFTPDVISAAHDAISRAPTCALPLPPRCVAATLYHRRTAID